MRIPDEVATAELPVVDDNLTDPVLTVADVATLLGVAPGTVVAFTRRRRAALPLVDDVVLAGDDHEGAPRFYRSEVEAWRREES